MRQDGHHRSVQQGYPCDTGTVHRAAHLIVRTAAVWAVVILTALLVSAVQFWREAVREVECTKNIINIFCALASYESQHGGFPPAGSTENDGRLGMSWRVAILPQLDRTDLFQQYDRKQPWNGSENRTVADAAICDYHCPSESKGPESRETSYVMLVGKGTVGGLPEKDRNSHYVHTHSGLTSTLLVVESRESGIHWAEPRDLTVDEFLARLKNGKGLNHSGGFFAVFCDGHVEFIRVTIPPNVLRALADPSRDKPIDASQWK